MSVASGENRGVWAPLLARLFAGAVAMLGLAGIGFAASRSPQLLLPGAAHHDSQLASTLSAPLGPAPSGAARPPSSSAAVVGETDAAVANAAPASGPAESPAAAPQCPCPCPSTSGSPPATSAPTAPAPPGGSAQTPDGRVILNRAGAEELQRLPGVGARRAAAILELRARLGRFRRADELLRIKGIGPRMLERMLPRLVLDPPPEPAP